jgi:hypothetical protein
MKPKSVRALLFTCVLAVPAFGQQKTYDWIPGNDQTVRLDPGYYYADQVYKPAPGTRSVHVDIEAQRPVTLAMVSERAWNDATQHPETMGSVSLLCVQEHVVQATYSCDLPWRVPMRLLVRDERGQRGFAGIGQVTRGRDQDRQQAPPQSANAGRPEDYEADRERERRRPDRPPGAGGDAIVGGLARRIFSYPNDVHISYYDWACTANCNLPDPPRPKLFDWVPGDTVVDRLDPGEFFHGSRIDFASTNVVYHFDLEARWPVTIAVVPIRDWDDAIAQHFGKNLGNLDYVCIQRHVVKATFNCKIDYAQTPLFMVVLDERVPLSADQYTQLPAQAAGQSSGQNTAQPSVQSASRPTAPPIGQAAVQKVSPPVSQQIVQTPGPVERAALTAGTAGGNLPRPLLAPNEVRRLGYVWRCVDACDQPDYGWVSQVDESYPLTNALKIYGGAVIPDQDGEKVNIHVKSPVPMAVAMVRAKVAKSLYSEPDRFESTIENSSCSQRGVQQSTLECTFNTADGPQSLVVLPEAGTDIPPHKKADVTVQAFTCVDNCRGPSFSWVTQVHEKYALTNILKMYGGIGADYDGGQVFIKIKSPVPMTAAVLPTRQAGQLYGKPDLFESEVKSSSCQQRNIRESTFQCAFDVADGPQSLVILPDPGFTLPRDKKAEVEINARKCVARCDSLRK